MDMFLDDAIRTTVAGDALDRMAAVKPSPTRAEAVAEGDDGSCVVRIQALAYGFTPKAIANARTALKASLDRPDVQFVAFDVGANFETPRTRLFTMLLADIQGAALSMGVATVAMPSGNLSGMALEFALACNMTTLDRGRGVILGHDAGARASVDWALGSTVARLMEPREAITGEEALELRLVEVLVDPRDRMGAVRRIVRDLAPKRSAFRFLHKSLAIVREAHRARELAGF